jgi:hypothetical protein
MRVLHWAAWSIGSNRPWRTRIQNLTANNPTDVAAQPTGDITPAAGINAGAGLANVLS